MDKVGKGTARPNAVGLTLKEETRKRIEGFVAKYYKQDKAQVVWEIVEQYIDKYEEAEEVKLQRLTEQGVLGKTPAPATEVASRIRRVRRSA